MRVSSIFLESLTLEKYSGKPDFGKGPRAGGTPLSLDKSQHGEKLTLETNTHLFPLITFPPIAPENFISAITNLYNKFENIKVNCSMHMSVQSKKIFRSSNLALSAHIVLVEKKKKNCCHKKVTTSPVPFCENSAVRQRRLSPHGTQFECRRGFPAFCLLSTPPPNLKLLNFCSISWIFCHFL